MTNERELNKRRKVYINGGCLSKRHAQAAYQKQNRSREPPPRSLISTHASFLHTYYKRLFIVNAESWWRTYFSTSPPPLLLSFSSILSIKTFTPNHSRTRSLQAWMIIRASELFYVRLFRDKCHSQTISVSIFMEVVKSSMLHLVHNF